MKSRLIAVSCAFLFFACKRIAVIELDKNSLNDGKDRSFTLYNRGDANLVIENFTTSCECTTLNLKKNGIIAPGDSLNVPVKVDRINQDSDGEIYVTIKTNATVRLTSFHFKPDNN